jgi:hypothetical protein
MCQIKNLGIFDRPYFCIPDPGLQLFGEDIFQKL